MADKIKLLPDSISNQIAAGEVIQRPASVVKELLENALDAGATLINLIVKDAGRTLIQVTDNGSGMSATDARMCFEKHATSKIRQADDLFKLSSFGFRGEALASIAAIAQVELKTKTAQEELGTKILIEGSKFKFQETCSAPKGTSFSVKNLFYNVPARRNFLKSNPAELKHIIEEFQRIVMLYPDVQFNFYNKGELIYQLKKVPLKMRIAQTIGHKNIEGKLVPVSELTKDLKVHGFIGKPEFARKKRGEQFFFANNRFIKHPYFNHAVESAYNELIPDGAYPSYFIFLEVPKEDIDVNIHPTKIEVNFKDKQLIYAILSASVKKALGQFSLMPSLDFDKESSMDFIFPKDKPIKAPSITINPEYNPFESEKAEKTEREINNEQNWQQLYNNDSDTFINTIPNKENLSGSELQLDPLSNYDSLDKSSYIQLGKMYVLGKLQSGLLVVHQQYAHERILYEAFLEKFDKRQMASQQLMFPVTINLSAPDFNGFKQVYKELKDFGFIYEYLGKSSIVVNAAPMDIPESKIESILEEILKNLESGKQLTQNLKITFARTMARQLSIKKGQHLEPNEMAELMNKLFSCTLPNLSIDKLPVFKKIAIEEINHLFSK
jgi:DNA mismatch repair protein MutL